MHECPDGYSGCAGVANSGVHAGSSTVFGSPSLASAMAVTGRQKTNSYFASQQPIAASAIDRFTNASSRADSDSVRCRISANDTAAVSQYALAVPAFQNKLSFV